MTTTTAAAPRTLRACTVCGRRCEGKRCPTHGGDTRPYDQPDYRSNRAQVLAEETTCWICELPGTDTDPLTYDHLVPNTDNTRANGHAAHRSCNASRGAMGTEDSRGGIMSSRKATPAPNQPARFGGCQERDGDGRC